MSAPFPPSYPGGTPASGPPEPVEWEATVPGPGYGSSARPGPSWGAPVAPWGPPPAYGWTAPAPARPAGRWTLRPVAVLGIVVAAALVAALLTTLAFTSFRTGEGVAEAVGAGSFPTVDPSTVERFDPVAPGDLGPDPTLDAYAEECFGGGMQSCDDLYWAAPPLSEYESYGATCGGRVKEYTGVYCTDLD